MDVETNFHFQFSLLTFARLERANLHVGTTKSNQLLLETAQGAEFKPSPQHMLNTKCTE